MNQPPATYSRPALVLQTVYFDESDRGAARQLGLDLYDLLTRPLDDPLSFGAGIPVLTAVAADHVDLQAADEVVLIPVLGRQTSQRRRKRVIAQLKAWHVELGKGHVLQVPTARAWRGAENPLPVAQLLTELYGSGDRRKVTLEEIVLGVSRLFETDTTMPDLFISHAKADLEATEQAAKKIQNHVVSDTTGNVFFDEIRLYAGEPLEESLDRAARRGVFVAMRSDTYNSRVWCQRELLAAKQKGLPTLTVEVLHSGEPRINPYGGNGPALVWNGDAAAVATRAMVEWLRAVHFQREARRIRHAFRLPESTIALIRPPELLDLAQGPLTRSKSQLVLHPDPELAVPERTVLKSAHARLYLATPTTAFRRVLQRNHEALSDVPLHGLQVGMSLSDSPDENGPAGFTSDHVRDATVLLARALISAGGAIGYGGDYRRNGYTPLLAELIQAYNQTAAEPAEYLHSYLAATIDENDSPDLLLESHHLLNCPDMRAEAILPEPPPDPEPYLKALYVSEMRLVMTRHIQARIVVGGNAEPRLNEDKPGYGGRYPGVVEEAWRSLEVGQPVYVIGGFGGGAALVADLLESCRDTGSPVPERLRDDTWGHNQTFLTRAEQIDNDPFRTKLSLPGSMEELAGEVKSCAAPLLESDETAARWNGLTLAENRQLFRTRDPVLITSLVMRGLLNVNRQLASGKLAVELIHGSVADSGELDAIAVGAFDGIPLGGAGAALDEVAGGRAAAGRAAGRQLISISHSDINADWIYLASLGQPGEPDRMGEKIRDAARETAATAQRYGLRKIGVVAYGGNVINDIETVTESMLDGLADLAGFAGITWFESSEQRYGRLKEILAADNRVKLTTRPPGVAKVQLKPRQEPLLLQVDHANGRLNVRVLPPTGTAVAGFFTQNLSEHLLAQMGAGAAPAGRSTPDLASLESRGRELARLLLGNDADRILAHAADAKLVIVHDVATSCIPFEVLASSTSGPVAVRTGFNRRLAVSGVPVEHILGRPPAAGRFKVLLVINPTVDLKGATEEGRMVLDVLEQFPDLIEVKVLEEDTATKDAMLEELPKADLLHYCGHAFYNGPGDLNSGLILHGRNPLTLLDLNQIGTVPRIVFVNACEGIRVRGDIMIGAASFAEFFLRSGTEAFLGTFWLVGDKAAECFARTVYGELAAGSQLDDAVRSGRTALHEASEPDWANYILYGDGRFQLVTGT